MQTVIAPILFDFFFFQIFFFFMRQALFINGVMFNSEVWHGVKMADIELLSVLDNQILRYICGAHAKTPTEFLFLETGSLPLSYNIASRRMIYLQNILKRNQNELVRRVYIAQRNNPTEGDYCSLVEEDFKHVNISLTENAIIAMNEDQYKYYIKKHVKLTAFNYLRKIQEPHTKVNPIHYTNLTIQPYMTSKEFQNHEVKLLTALRSHTLRGIKMNFSSWYKPNLLCPLNCQNNQQEQKEDSQRHLLLCQVLLNQLTPEQQGEVQGITYNDIYAADLARQKLAVRVFSLLIDIRERLLEAVTPASGVSLVAAPTPGGNRGLP